MQYETLIREQDGPVALVTMNRPQKRNALDRKMLSELQSAFTDLAADAFVRAIVLTGAGGAFCAGADLSSVLEDIASAAAFHLRMRELNRLMESIASCPKPVIAAVDGVAVGGGCNLALVCDIVLASETARFAELFVRRGLTVDMGGTWALPRRIGLHRAKELAFLGDTLDAAEAERIGLVNRVVPTAELAETAKSLATRIAANAPLAIRLTKEGLNRSATMNLSDSLEYEAQAQSICFGSEDCREGILAFLEKRSPVFRGQ